MDRKLLADLLDDTDEKIAAHERLIHLLRTVAEDPTRAGPEADNALEALQRHELSLSLHLQHRQRLAEG